MTTQARPPKGSWWRFWKREFWSHKSPDTNGWLLGFTLLLLLALFVGDLRTIAKQANHCPQPTPTAEASVGGGA